MATTPKTQNNYKKITKLDLSNQNLTSDYSIYIVFTLINKKKVKNEKKVRKEYKSFLSKNPNLV